MKCTPFYIKDMKACNLCYYSSELKAQAYSSKARSNPRYCIRNPLMFLL